MRKLESQITYSTEFALSSVKDYSPDELMTQIVIILSRLRALTNSFPKERLLPCTNEGILHKLETTTIISAVKKLGSVAEGCHPPNCVLEINPPGKPINCYTCKWVELRLVARDSREEPVGHGGETVKAEIVRVTRTQGEERFVEEMTVVKAGSVHVYVKDNNDGTYQIGFQISSEGDYKLFVTLRNQNVSGSPFHVVVNAPVYVVVNAPVYNGDKDIVDYPYYSQTESEEYLN